MPDHVGCQGFYACFCGVSATLMGDPFANGHDQSDRARAAVRTVELRLASGALDKTQAADALEAILGYQVTEVPGASHFAAYDAPEQFARMLTGIIAERRTSR